MRILVRILLNALGLYLISLLPGIHYTGGLVYLLLAGLALGLLNLVVKPILTILSCPLLILTLGLFYLVINGAVLYLLDYFLDQDVRHSFHGDLAFSFPSDFTFVPMRDFEVAGVFNYSTGTPYTPEDQKAGAGEGEGAMPADIAAETEQLPPGADLEPTYFVDDADLRIRLCPFDADDPDVAAALREVTQLCTFFRLLGSYPRATSPT